METANIGEDEQTIVCDIIQAVLEPAMTEIVKRLNHVIEGQRLQEMMVGVVLSEAKAFMAFQQGAQLAANYPMSELPKAIEQVRKSTHDNCTSGFLAGIEAGMKHRMNEAPDGGREMMEDAIDALTNALTQRRKQDG